MLESNHPKPHIKKVLKVFLKTFPPDSKKITTISDNFQPVKLYFIGDAGDRKCSP